MIEHDTKRLFPAGHLSIHSPHIAFGVNVGRKEAAKHSERLNQPDYLQKNFIEVPALYEKKVTENITVKTLRPTMPYGYGGVIVFILDTEQVATAERNNATVQTTNVYDYEYDVQVEYFRQILAGLKVMEGNPPSIASKGRSVALENTTVDISNATHRIGRSVAFPHTQVCTFGDGIRTELPLSLPYSQVVEQRILKQPDIAETYGSEIGDRLMGIKNIKTFSLRLTAPFGYTLGTDIALDADRETQARSLQTIMQANHITYADIVKRAIDNAEMARQKPRRIEEILIPQPSYRTYMYIEDGRVSVSFSPVILSGAAVIEAAEVIISRSPENPKQFTEEELDEMYVSTGKKLLDLLT